MNLKISLETIAMPPRIYVDFNTMMTDNERRIFLARAGFEQASLLPLLQVGSRVTLFDEELEVQATVEYVIFSNDYQAWFGRPDWATRNDKEAI